MSSEVTTLLIAVFSVGAALGIGLGTLILTGQSSTAKRFDGLEARLRSVEQVQAQHSILLKLAAHRELDSDLPQPPAVDAPVQG